MAELRERLRIIGRVDGNNFDMPLNQEQIGEALGITAVHAFRENPHRVRTGEGGA